ncbi:Holliday junction resolvase [compost metagenome]
MRVLFCDQSMLRFGFCIVEIQRNYCEVIAYGLLKLNGKLHYIERLQQIERWLNRWIKEYSIDEVVCEEIQFQHNVQTFRKLAILQYVIETICYQHCIRFPKPLQVHVWRTKGVRGILQLTNGSKQTLFQFLNSYLGFPPYFDTNQADALGMAVYWCNRHDETLSLSMKRAIQLQIKGEGIC